MSNISREFGERLLGLKPHQTVRTVLMLDTRRDDIEGKRPPARGSRSATIEAIRKAAAPALSDIDRILEEYGGRRLAPEVDALGSIPVETTAAGIRALAERPYVKAVLEDQPVSLL